MGITGWQKLSVLGVGPPEAGQAVALLDPRAPGFPAAWGSWTAEGVKEGI